MLKIKKQIRKIIQNPEIGKPMKNVRKGTREIYVSPFRISYVFHKNKDTIEFLEVYHKKKQWISKRLCYWFNKGSGF